MFLFFRTIKNRNRKKIAIGLKLSNFQIGFIILQINVRHSRPSSTNADRCLYGNGSFFTCALISSQKTWTLVQLDSGSGLGPPLHPTSIRPSAGNTVTWPPKGGWGGKASHPISTNLLRCHFGPERRHDRRTWTGRRVRSIDLAWSVSNGRMTKTSAENSTCRSPDFFTITSRQLVSTHPSIFPFQLPELLLTQEHHQRYVSVLLTLKKKSFPL